MPVVSIPHHAVVVGHHILLFSAYAFGEGSESMLKTPQTSAQNNYHLEKGLVLTKFFESAPMMMGVVDVSGDDIIHVSDNEASASFFGSTPEALSGKHASELGISPELLTLWVSQYRKAERTQGPVHFEYEHKGKRLSATVTFIEKTPGGHSRFSYIVNDLTEMALLTEATEKIRESEERFRGIANALPQIIWTATADLHVDWYNDWWYQYLNLPRGTVWDDPETSPMHPEDVEKTKQRIRDSISGGKDFEMVQRFRRGSDGQYRWHLVRGLPVRDSQGNITRWVGANTDIHDQKILLDELQSERVLRDRFVAALSHDLRTPLTAAKMSAQIIARKPGDADIVLRSAGRIVDNMNRADEMIRDLLDVNRLKAGEKLPLDVKECLLNKIVAETLDDLVAVHGDRFQFHSSGEISGHWSCSGIRRILENLCNNAIKYGSDTQPVTISVEESNKFVFIKVHNEGRVIPSEERAILFEAFRRAESAHSSGERGWGLGLTLVKGLAEAHDGSVSVESEPDKGTTFTVKLPIGR